MKTVVIFAFVMLAAILILTLVQSFMIPMVEAGEALNSI